MRKIIAILICLFMSNNAYTNPKNVLKLSCEFDPNLIRKEQNDVGFVENDKIDNKQICESLGCKDFIEVNQYNISKSENEYRLRNSWFNHQGILLDDYSTVKDTITINTFVSQAYYLESYTINKITGETKRLFYSFNDPKFFNDMSKLETSTKKKVPLYNEKGKLSLKTLELFSLKPKVIFHFEGKCYKGLPI